MKIGLYGAVANASYVTARALNNQGVDIIYIRDHLDMFPFSQPVWEDSEFTLSYDAVNQPWSLLDWQGAENQYGWAKPSWIRDPLETTSAFKSDCFNIKWIFKKILEKIYVDKQPHRAGVIDLMRECDFLYVCGIEAEILAWASDVPYVIWPHGGDIRLAAGLSPRQGKGIRNITSHFVLRFYLMMAYRDCLWIGTHDPKGVGGNVGTIPYDLEYFPLPLLDRPVASGKQKKHEDLKQLMGNLGLKLPHADYYIFIPSRVDFIWKGTDLLLKAIARLDHQEKFHFIFSGWGQNYHEAKEMIDPAISSFLPCSLSKPLLFRFYQAVDLVVDQFLFGSYGAAAIEAMSCSTPVMMSIDDHEFEARGWEPPPVLNARTEDQILTILQDIQARKIDLEECGCECLSWFKRTHSESVSVRHFLSSLQEKMGNT